MSGNFDALVAQYQGDVTKNTEKYNVLKDLDLFVLDNSIRESTVGKQTQLFALLQYLMFIVIGLRNMIYSKLKRIRM